MKRFDLYLMNQMTLISMMIVMLMCLGFEIGLSNGSKFYVGGRDGWVLAPSEAYSHWSHRIRFQVNDTLHFKYAKEKDSVLEVTEADYNTCNTTHPISSLSDGDSVFTLSRSGPFFFISGNSNCFKGEKLAVTVMSSVHHSHTPPPPHPSPSPSPSLSPVQQSPAPSPGAVASDANVHAQAPAPARNYAGSVGPSVASLGMVLVIIMISSMF